MTHNKLAGYGNGGYYLFLDHSVLLSDKCAKEKVDANVTKYKCWIEAMFVKPEYWCDPLGTFPLAGGGGT